MEQGMTDCKPDWQGLVPEVTLRPVQHETLDRIWNDLYVEDNDVVFFEAPTGVGKSIVMLALMRWDIANNIADGFMVTPQRVLQDQLGKWSDVRVMKGRGSYQCALVRGATAASAPCTLDATIRELHVECGDAACPYYNALMMAKACPAVIHNYMSLMAQAHIGKHFGQRRLLCLDEGHTAVGWVRQYVTAEFTDHDCKLLSDSPPSADIGTHEFMKWFRLTLMRLDEVPSGASERLSLVLSRVLSHRAAYGIPRWDAESRSILREKWRNETGEIGASFDDWLAERIEHDSRVMPFEVVRHEPCQGEQYGRWEIIPLRVAPLGKMLTGMGAKVVIVSATILDVDLCALEIGLKDAKRTFVRCDRAFDPGNRPIAKRYAGSMSFKKKRETMPKLVDCIRRIADDHRDEPGIIHSVSYALAWDIAKELRPMLSGRPVVMLKRGEARDATIHTFLTGGFGSNAILIGPSLMEGIDGKGDCLRWQVMAKVPWPHMHDPVVKWIMHMPGSSGKKWANRWYLWKAAQQSVQGFGRACRTPSDYGSTYLLDSGFERILSSGFMPKYVVDAIL